MSAVATVVEGGRLRCHQEKGGEHWVLLCPSGTVQDYWTPRDMSPGSKFSADLNFPERMLSRPCNCVYCVELAEAKDGAL